MGTTDDRFASTGVCPFCGATLRSDQKVCSSCGANNPNYVEDAPRRIFHPTTIEELKEYCAERGMPLLRMRFFIGEDYQEPRAFGIYRDGDRFVVYKNKDNGSRAVRYDGPDEAYAVNEIFQKLLSECHNRGIYPDREPGSNGSRSGAGTIPGKEMSTGKALGQGCGILLLVTLILLAGTAVIMGAFLGFRSIRDHKGDGYYRYVDQAIYYKNGARCYCGAPEDDWWIPTGGLPYGKEAAFLGKEHSDSWGFSAFDESRAGYPSTGYYRLSDGSWYYFYGSVWYGYDEAAWKEQLQLPQCPAGFKAPEAYLGWDHDPVWDVPDVDETFAIAVLKDSHSRDGYYRFGDAIYYYYGYDYDPSQNWYAYGGNGWQSAAAPEGDWNEAFVSAEPDPAWGVPDAAESFAVVTKSDEHGRDGYYRFGEDLYYYYGKYYDPADNWYTYDGGDWTQADAPEGSYDEAYEGEDWDADWGRSSFTDSDTWDDLQPSYSGSDSGSSWDSGSSFDSWDSGSTDWSSDW